MIAITFSEAARACGGELVNGEKIGNRLVSGVFIDSRRVTTDSLFVALRGERVDGHDFIDKAIENGACCALSERETEACHIRVRDSFEAMKALAAYVRRKSGIKVIAIVGSVGKTSTRRMVSCVLSQKLRVHSTEGNFNNEYGVPQTLFTLEGEDEVSVLELGISHFGEMDRLGAIAEPDYAVYTNIGSMHLENLIDRDGVLKAKTELIPHMRADGRLFFNGEDDKLRAYQARLPVVYFGMGEDYAIHPENIRQNGIESVEFDLCFADGAREHVCAPFIGRHMIMNAVAAANVAVEFGLTPVEICRGIESYSPVGHRGRMLRHGGAAIIDDCYNAGPDSVRASVSALASEGRRIALLGDMLELGETTDQLHYELGRFCSEGKLDVLIAVGDKARFIAKGAIDGGAGNVHYVSRQCAAEFVNDILKDGDVLLVKASRGMQFEKLIDEITAGKVCRQC